VLLQEVGNIEIVAEGAVFRLWHFIKNRDGTGGGVCAGICSRGIRVWFRCIFEPRFAGGA
jgi:hypothetical protein